MLALRPLRMAHATVTRRSSPTPGGTSRVRGVVFCIALAAFALLGCVNQPIEHRVRANAYFRGGQYVEALNECNLGLAIKPDDVGTLILRAKSLFELDRLPEAKADYQRALALGEGKRKTYVGDAYLGLAILASREQNWKEARAEFEHLLATDPEDVGTRTNLARVCLELGDLSTAEEHAQVAVALRGQDEAALFTLGRVLLAEGKLELANSTFARIAVVNPRASSAPYGMATVAAKEGDRDAALEKLSEAIALKVPNPQEIPDDPAFLPLQHDPEFVRLVAQAEK
jgi:tetratricopeptide (TPR) repeat protein